MNKSLDSRQKGDIYWRKLKRYIAAYEDRGIVRDERKILAKDIFLAIQDGVAIEKPCYPTGNEFKVFPPTEAAREAFKKGMTELARFTAAPDLGEGYDKDLIRNALGLFFRSAGIDSETGKNIGAAEQAKAAADAPAVFARYEKAVKSIRKKEVVSFINELVKGADITEDTSFEDHMGPLAKEADHQVLNRAYAEYVILSKKESGMKSRLEAIGKLIEGDRNLDPYALEAFDEYSLYVREELRAVSFAKSCCMAFAESLVNKKIADPLFVDYISDHWGFVLPHYLLDERICTKEGFTRIGLVPVPQIPVFKTFPEFVKEGESLKEYVELHRERFEDQSVGSLFFGTEEIPVIHVRAGSLLEQMTIFGLKGGVKALSYTDRLLFKDIYVRTDTIARVTELIINYAAVSEYKTFRDVLREYADKIYEMDYRYQERLSIRGYEEVLERRFADVL